MDPFTVALAVFGVQKLRGQSTGKSFRDALMAATATYGIGQATQAGYLGGTEGVLGSIGQGEAFSGIKSLIGTSPLTAEQAVAKGLETGTSAYADALKGSGFLGMDTGSKILTGATVLPLVGSALAEEPEKPKELWTEEDYKKARERQPNLNLQAVQQTARAPESVYNYSTSNPYYKFNKGGIVDALPKFAVGGVNYMPSKTTHDENDVYNYTRASGYVVDGSGTGEKDTDTILAQLADGEFVSRTDAVLGAGIMAGASPNNMKEMRKLGAAYFYDQQDKFKRIFDLLDASRKTN